MDRFYHCYKFNQRCNASKIYSLQHLNRPHGELPEKRSKKQIIRDNLMHTET